jgi:hypothetical protein
VCVCVYVLLVNCGLIYLILYVLSSLHARQRKGL